ncbi:sensor histidine kinase [Verticiella sediminum]|uniref:Sensor histidine kinase n=1 Tax=Verticiella sediminum TaxID=1247510 RepID=A0A556AMP3_9BURK|nr:histidine kinase [Verticiella sediminum]TSH94137.1 sensor histidine kinase [Verticiella sediminum]
MAELTRPPFAGRRPALLSFGITLAASTLVALVLAALVPGVGGWRSAATHAYAIGLLGWACIDGGRRLLWPRRAPPVAGMLLLSAAGMLAAFVLGSLLAAALLGSSADWLLGMGEQRPVLVAAAMATLVATTLVAGSNWAIQATAALRLRAQLDQARADAAEHLADDAQLRLLRAQLDPHMLFNTLATLRALVALDPARAEDMLDRLVEFLRATLEGSRRLRHALRDEFGVLEDYLHLMAIRLGSRLRYRLDLPPALAGHGVPALLLQPLVENALRHGLEPLREGGEIQVAAWRDGAWLCLAVVDTGAGMAPPPSGAASFGLDAVRRRLAASYGEDAYLEIASPWPAGAGGGTRVLIALPLSREARRAPERPLDEDRRPCP